MNIRSVIGFAIIQIEQIGFSVTGFTVETIVTTSSIFEFPAVRAGCTLNHVIIRSIHAQIQTAVDVLEHIFMSRIDSRALLAVSVCIDGTIRTGWNRLVRTEIKTGMRRLIISRLLGRNLRSVLRVMHQALNSVISIISRAVNPDSITTRRTDD